MGHPVPGRVGAQPTKPKEGQDMKSFVVKHGAFAAMCALVLVFMQGCSKKDTPPTAAFTYTTTGLSASFRDASTPGNTAITGWSWTFGDGGTSSAPNPSHTYAAIGAYSVTLTVTSNGGQNTASATVTLTGNGSGENTTGIWRVKQGGSGNGSSWSKALGSIQDAIDAASQGEEVWVAAGTYCESAGETPLTLGQDAEYAVTLEVSYGISMKSGVSLYGGFSGGETSRDDRDVENNATIIDGQGIRTCVFNGESDDVLDGFVLQNGHGELCGGLCVYGAAPSVINCLFTGNVAEWNQDSDFSGVAAGLFNYLAAPQVIECVFAENEGTYAGGIYSLDSAPEIVYCGFYDNYGSGVITDSWDDYSSSFIWGCDFLGNASYEGGAICNYDYSECETTNCVIAFNSACYGGGVCNYPDAAVSLINSTLAGNGATYDEDYGEGGVGGAVYNLSVSPTLVNCILWGDYADTEGAEIYNDAYEGGSPSNPSVGYSCVQGGHTGTGNIVSDPQFTDPDNGDFSLQSASPCIDTGTAVGAPEEDYWGVERPQGAGYDMGAFEYEGK
ncbi:MAG: PKD domain-containing protein [Firmicutes bacterium]|nr:PKD domain-containing protein [Bacillota bacterium]